MTERQYWKLSYELLQYNWNKIDSIDLNKYTDLFWNECSNRIIHSIDPVNKNYTGFKLVINGNFINEDTLFNNLFQVNTQSSRLRNLFLNTPDRFFGSCIFLLTLSSANKLQKIVSDEFKNQINKKLDLEKMKQEINDCPLKDLYSKYPNTLRWAQSMKNLDNFSIKSIFNIQDCNFNFKDFLKVYRRNYPFQSWFQNTEFPYDRFEILVRKSKIIIDELLVNLNNIKNEHVESDKCQLFEKAVKAFNQLHEDSKFQYIETIEAGQLVTLFNEIAEIFGLNPTIYGHGEGIASEWRDW